MTKPLLALTMGEPGGIAGEITIAAWRAFSASNELDFFVIGDANYFEKFADGIEIARITSPDQAAELFNSRLPVLHTPLSAPVKTGIADSANARAVIASIEQAVAFALGGEIDGMVTNPIQKESLYDAGFPHQGHTDFLADLANQAGHKNSSVMMLSSMGLRTVPITVHIALKDVPEALSKDLIEEQTRISAAGLSRWFGLPKPRIGITGLNPHAGEGGSMGTEEIEYITPAIQALKEQGFDAAGPLPADTLFHEEARVNYDIIMCMYHDQALIPVKTLGFHDGVNTTLGLPFIRTSPDHGTALGLAGQGIANPSSLIAALRQAGQMAQNEKDSQESTLA